MQLASYLAYLAGSDLRLAIYFLLGGAVTVLTAYFASQGRGMLSAFITRSISCKAAAQMV
jgi:hypothetical protein